MQKIYESKTIVYLSLTLILASCFDPELKTIVVTGDIEQRPDELFATAQGIVISVNEAIVQYGHCWVQDPLGDRTPSLEDIYFLESGTRTKGEYISVLDRLRTGTDYAVRAVVITARRDTLYGKKKNFRTFGLVKEDPVKMLEVGDITRTTATAVGSIDLLTRTSFRYGHCWQESVLGEVPTIEEDDTTAFEANEASLRFESVLSNLAPGTDYTILAYMIDENDSVTYNQESFSFTTIGN